MFKFPLQRLLDLRARHEQEMARQLACARDDADAQRLRRDALLAAQEAAQSQLLRPAGEMPTVGELVSLGYAMTQFGEHVNAACDETLAAEQVVDKQHQALTSAVQDRQVLDRLKDRRLEAHRADEVSKDRELMDAIALTRFNGAAASRRGSTEEQ